MAASEEDKICMGLTRYIALQYPWAAENWLHIPNGGKRDKREAAKFRAMGVRKGVSDYLWLLPRGGYGSLFLEVKTDKGRPTEDQIKFVKMARGNGALAVIGYGWEECKLIVDSWADGKLFQIEWLADFDMPGARKAERKMRLHGLSNE